MKVRMTVEMPAGTRVPDDVCRIDNRGRRWVPVGTEFEGPDVYLMMVHGCAEPADAEAVQYMQTLGPSTAVGALLKAHQSITQDMEEFQAELEAEIEDE